MPGVGEEAPDFELPAHDGGVVRLRDLRGRPVVLYFYPKANTPGCTLEGRAFNELIGEFERMGAVVLGVSVDKPEANRRFCEKHGFRFKLLSDVKGEVARRYGVLRNYRLFKLADRVTFIIDGEGRIREVIRGVKPQEHARLAYESLKSIS